MTIYFTPYLLKKKVPNKFTFRNNEYKLAKRKLIKNY